MAQPALPAEGGCRCGRVRFRITVAPAITAACHCRGCQLMTGSAFSLTAAVPEDGFAVIAGEVVIGGLHAPDQHHHFCDRCMSWTFTTLTPSHGFVNVRASLFDEPSWFTPFIETQTAEKLAWVDLPVRRSFAGWPAPEDYGPLLAEYSAIA